MRLMVLLVLGYVSADLADPFSPGAFTFDPAQSVEMSRSDEDPWDEPVVAREADTIRHSVPSALAPPSLARLPAPLVSAPVRVAPRGLRTGPLTESSGLASDSDH